MPAFTPPSSAKVEFVAIINAAAARAGATSFPLMSVPFDTYRLFPARNGLMIVNPAVLEYRAGYRSCWGKHPIPHRIHARRCLNMRIAAPRLAPAPLGWIVARGRIYGDSGNDK